MLATLQIELEIDDKNAINYSDGSLFQGALMEYLEPDYVDCLHNQVLNPYSQYVYYDKDKECYIWNISTLTKEAKRNIIDVLLENLGDCVHLTQNDVSLGVKSKNIINIKSYKEIADRNFLEDEKNNIVNIKLLTPATYKSNGDYQIFPSVRALYCSIYNKWNSFSEEISLADDEVFNHIVNHSEIIGYNLHSYKYHIENVRLNSFYGDFRVLLKGPKELVSIINMLMEYGEYCGIGAKTSMGMGGMKIGK